jgi:hypothetical protein
MCGAQSGDPGPDSGLVHLGNHPELLRGCHALEALELHGMNHFEHLAFRVTAPMRHSTPESRPE